jgi:hypothetical protein
MYGMWEEESQVEEFAGGWGFEGEGVSLWGLWEIGGDGNVAFNREGVKYMGVNKSIERRASWQTFFDLYGNKDMNDFMPIEDPWIGYRIIEEYDTEEVNYYWNLLKGKSMFVDKLRDITKNSLKRRFVNHLRTAAQAGRSFVCLTDMNASLFRWLEENKRKLEKAGLKVKAKKAKFRKVDCYYISW